MTTISEATVPASPDADATVGGALDAFPEDFFPSVIHDLRSGRRTEMEDLGCAIAGMAREAGVEVPLHEAATLAVSLGASGAGERRP